VQTLIIAEAGISHGGSFIRAIQCIDHAKEAGCNSVKFQYFDAKKLAEARKKPELAEILKPYEMPKSWLPQLAAECEKADIEFMATAYYPEGLDDIEPYVWRFKIGSAEAVDRDFVNLALSYNRPVIASDGYGATIITSDRLSWLHCVSKYPCQMADADLLTVRKLDGYSDHTRNVLTGALAVVAGAKIVEVHFEPWNADHPDKCVSLSPYELWQYVENIRVAEQAVYGESASRQGSPVPPLKLPARPPA
jgi:N,N'-diacetyllegionaminate synthase